MYTNIIIINIICININNKCCTCVIINFSELFSRIYPSSLWILLWLLNNGQNYGDQECPVFRCFAVHDLGPSRKNFRDTALRVDIPWSWALFNWLFEYILLFYYSIFHFWIILVYFYSWLPFDDRFIHR
jgi:hypothetical protein